MSRTLNDFSELTSILDNDFLIGFRNATSGGERKWKWQALKSSIINNISVSPSQVKAWGVLSQGTQGNGNLTVRVESGYNISTTVQVPAPSSPFSVTTDKRSLRISFTQAINGFKCVVVGSTYGSGPTLMYGSKVGNFDANLLERSTYIDFLWAEWNGTASGKHWASFAIIN
jgi:hypothetical protein